MARGEGVLPDSDIDVLVVLNGDVDPLDENWRHTREISKICLKYDILLSVIFVSSHEYDTGRTPLLINVHREGVAV